MTTRTIVGLAAGVVVLGLLVVSAVVGSNRKPAAYEPGTPEAAVQAYFQALIDNRPADVHEFYSAELADRCDPSNFDVYSRFDVYSPPLSRVVLDEVISDGSDAAVVVLITQSWDDGLLLTTEDTFSETLSLTNEDGRWVFDQVPWPYPCPPVPVPTTTTVPPPTTTEVEP